jgi:hypothetical protein
MIKRFLPYAVGSFTDWGGAKTAQEQVDAINPGDPPFHDEEGSRLSRTGPAPYTGNEPGQDFKIDTDFPEKFSSVSSLTVYFRIREEAYDTDVQVGVTLDNWTGATWCSAVEITGSWATYSEALARPGGGNWTESDLRNSSFRFGIRRVDTGLSYWVVLTSLWFEIEYTPSVTAVIFPRETASRLLRWSRSPVGIVEVVCGLEGLDIELGEIFAISHYAGPNGDGGGWGDELWERRLFRLIGYNINPNDRTVTLRGKDLRPYACHFMDTAVAPWSVQSDTGEVDGPIRLDRGCTRTHTRSGYVYLQEPNGYVVQIGANVEPIGPSGLLIEESKQNKLSNSSMTDWTALLVDSWTKEANATLAKYTTNLLFDPTLTAQGVTVTRGATTGHISQTVSGWDGYAVVSIDHLDGDNPGEWWLYRDSASNNWWDDSTETWTTATSNVLPSVSTITRFKSNPIDTSVARNYALYLGSAAGGASAYGHFFHAQIEDAWFASSRILTNDSVGEPYTRSNPTLTISNDQGRRCWPAEKGTLLFRFTPSWSSADYSTGALNAGLFEVKHTTDYFRVYYDVDNEQWEFVRYDGSTTATAIYAGAVIEDTEYHVACRWMGTGGEHGLTDYTISIFVDGVKGTDDIGLAVIDEDNDVDMTIGDYTAANGTRADGFISDIEIIPFVLSDTEIAARAE